MTCFKQERSSIFVPATGPLAHLVVIKTSSKIAEVQEMSHIHNSISAFNILKTKFNPQAEEFWLMTMDPSLSLTGLILLTKGTLNYCPVHPRDLFRECVKANAFTFIIAHNHPSLNVLPSDEDLKLTRRLFKLSLLLEIPMTDHIIFSDKNYFSLRENNSIRWK